MTEPPRTSPEPPQGGSREVQLFRAFPCAEPPEPPLVSRLLERGGSRTLRPGELAKEEVRGGSGGSPHRKRSRLMQLTRTPSHAERGFASPYRGFAPVPQQEGRSNDR